MQKTIKATVTLRTDARGGIFFRIPIGIARIMNLAPGEKAEITLDLSKDGVLSVKILED